MYLLVNWTDVTSTESQPGGPQSAFVNKIRDLAHKRTPTILTLHSLVHGPAPFRAESGDLTISLLRGGAGAPAGLGTIGHCIVWY